MATRKTQRGRGEEPRLAHNQEAGGSNPPPATDERDTERPPAAMVPLSDEQRQALTLIEELTERMVTRGIRRVSLRGHFGSEVELELDPAAQYINRGGDSSVSADTATPSPKVAGECIVASCKEKGGWLSTGFCREHFHAEMRNPRGTR